MLDQIIDKLDLQEAIRQKARIFFNKQEEKLKFSQSNLDKIKELAVGNVTLTLLNDRANQVLKKVNEGIQIPGSKTRFEIDATGDAAQILNGVARNKSQLAED